MLINYYIGEFFKRLGYKVVPNYKYPHSTINIIELGYALLSGNKDREINIVQIGVFDGKISDPLQNIFKNNNNSRVLLVEPQPKPFNELVKAYGNRSGFYLVNAAVTEKEEKINLYLPGDEEYSPKASITKSHFKRFSIKEKSLKSIQVEGITAKSLFNKYSISSIDLLQIDTEGQDYNILKQIFGLNILPKIINLESFHLDQNQRNSLRKDLSNRGYVYLDVDYDTFAVHKDLLKA